MSGLVGNSAVSKVDQTGARTQPSSDGFPAGLLAQRFQRWVRGARSKNSALQRAYQLGLSLCDKPAEAGSSHSLPAGTEP